MNNKFSSIATIICSIAMITGLGYLTIKVSKFTNISTENIAPGTNVSISNGKQVIALTAKGGYSPVITMAAANKDTILRVATTGTFDCSSALAIPSLKIRKNLPASGTTEIELGTPAPGTKIAGTCSMGMYKFDITFN